MNRIKAGSLLITVMISFILSIFCSSLLLIAYFGKLGQKKSSIIYKLQVNSASAISEVLTDSFYTVNENKLYDLFGSDSDSVSVSKEIWGIFQLATVKSFYRKYTNLKSFFYAPNSPDSLSCSIYQADHQRPIITVGNTMIIGDVFLSKAGLRRGFIEMNGYENDSLLYSGLIKNSGKKLPELNQDVLRSINSLVQKCYDLNPENSVNEVDVSNTSRDFSDTVRIIKFRGDTHLGKCNIAGKVVIISDSVINVMADAILTDIILVSPVINFETGFRGSLQAIATDSLVLGSDCHLVYPSALILRKNNDRFGQQQPRLIAGKRCRVEGVIASLTDEEDIIKSYVELGEQNSVIGMIYTMGYLNLGSQSSVSGCVATDFFLYKSPVAVYENYLVDVTISRPALPDFFVCSSLFGKSKFKRIMKWLN